jgi:hypothetical protein
VFDPNPPFSTVDPAAGCSCTRNFSFEPADCRLTVEAVPKLLLAMQEAPSFALPYRHLGACYAHMGRLDDAREIVERKIFDHSVGLVAQPTRIEVASN